MESLPYLLPWVMCGVAAAIAVAVKFLRIRSIAGLAVTIVLSLVLGATAIYSNVLVHQHEARVSNLEASIAAEDAWKQQHMDELTLTLAKLKPPTDPEQRLFATLSSYGWLSNNGYFTAMEEAQAGRARIMAAYKATDPMLLKGIPQNVDYEIMSLSLREVGFTVIPYGDTEVPETMVNILYFGRGLELEDVQLAALTLLRAGVVLKAIKPFPKPTRGNQRAIKLEWNKYYQNRSPLTPKDIETAKQFT